MKYRFWTAGVVMLILAALTSVGSAQLPPDAAGIYHFFGANSSSRGQGKLVLNSNGSFTVQFISQPRLKNSAAVGTYDSPEGTNAVFYRRRPGDYKTETSGYLNLVYVPGEPGYFQCRFYEATYWETVLRDEFHAYKRTEAGPLAGRYTALLTPAEYPVETPSEARIAEGSGWSVIKVRPDGKVKITGRLPNNRQFIKTSWVRPDGGFWLHNEVSRVSNYQPSPDHVRFDYFESITGLITLAPEAERDGSGSLAWDFSETPKDIQPSKLAVEVSRYEAPILQGTPTTTPYSLTLNGGGIGGPIESSFTLRLTLSGLRARDLAPPMLKMAIPPRGGLLGSFNGSLQFAGEGIQRPFSGVFLQKQGYGGGFFKGPQGAGKRSGSLEIAPAAVQEPAL